MLAHCLLGGKSKKASVDIHFPLTIDGAVSRLGYSGIRRKQGKFMYCVKNLCLNSLEKSEQNKYSALKISVQQLRKIGESSINVARHFHQ